MRTHVAGVASYECKSVISDNTSASRCFNEGIPFAKLRKFDGANITCSSTGHIPIQSSIIVLIYFLYYDTKLYSIRYQNFRI